MTASTTSRGADRRPYALRLEPDGRAWTARENLTDIIERELLGPAGGPDELLDGSPDAAYLVGRIAPAALEAGSDDPQQAGEGEAATDVGDSLDADDQRGVPVTGVDDGSVGGDDDGADDAPPRRGLMVPASMGLRFQVPDNLESFTVHASWGIYQPVRRERDGDATRGAHRRYQRVPIDVTTTVTVADLTAGRTTDIVLKDDVRLRIDRYDDAERHRLLMDLALCNDRETPRQIPVDAWLYQTKLYVSAGDEPVFLPVTDLLVDAYHEPDDELRRLNLQYRDRLEFAIGRTCSASWHQVPGTRLASKVWTDWLPTVETPQTRAEPIDEAMLDMLLLADATPEALQAGLEPIVTRYAAWLDERAVQARELPEHLQDDALELVDEARRVHRQLVAGLEHLIVDDEARRCFAFMNRVMADQRVQTQVAAWRTNRADLGVAAARDEVLAEGPKAHSWRPFQLAFVLMQLPLLSDPAATVRSADDLARAQLLFFPTGGGKTEAYLGLAAYTFAMRRRQGLVATDDGDLDGGAGVAVLMRYTLRLLTAQQFQRATALVCAAELARRDDPDTWGSEPFRIGLWVGTDVSPKRYDEAAAQLTKVNEGRAHRLTVLQVQRCPWCGSPIGSAQVRAESATRRVLVHCGEEFGECPFSAGGAVADGLPMLTVDEEIYRLAPAFVIATVDKFARLAREGEAAALFGYVSKRCERHGFVHPDYPACDLKDGSKHPRSGGLPAAGVRPAQRLRPPDLIIQDELHLISGALGTTVGLFEVAVDVLCSWTTAAGDPVRPLVVASTATVRNAHDQVRALYGRDVTIFPPQVIDAGRTFFSTEQAVSASVPGRRYVGISASGVRLTTAEIRVSEVLMAAGQLLLDRSPDADGSDADPYLTLVGYFNATRELAGMTRYLGDDVQTALAKRRPWSLLPARYGTDYGSLHAAELTARVSSRDIGATLDRMAVPFSPQVDSAAGRAAIGELLKRGGTPPKREVNPYDVVLATSMLQVGVDVTRLGLMLMVGQPKNTAEYIQASSRVGREALKPGLVVSLGNWARPRDLAHFEAFRHYHETFYAQVEALSVTPFSATALERGVDGLLISAVRVSQATVPSGLSPERSAGRIVSAQSAVESLIDRLVARVLKAAPDEAAAARARDHLQNRLDQWLKRRHYLDGDGRTLVYERVGKATGLGALMMSAENAKKGFETDQPPFRVPNSMREVQPEINVLVSPVPERLIVRDPDTAPIWNWPDQGKAPS